ncbi:hypothetical protein [Pseudomonas fluorescens]|uniref:Transmembrane protein n=1 Tax=Pseudomonas fluorescens TaxID=294 RepID=A0A5E7N1V3_PSEFL|nr:hypothetical protein [Pseudomonas fluorescens]VVP30323.1 hypothetical protein PS880_04303 [Pseudomonas fluorescens]
MSDVTIEKTIPQSTQSRWEKLAGLAFYAALLAYLGLCVYSSIELNHEVPVSYEDLRSSSWLSYTNDHYFGQNFPRVFSVFVIGFGILFIVTGRGLMNGLAMVPIGVCMIVSSNEASLFRAAVIDGTAKIGCFSYEGRECREMLSLDTAGTLPMYQDPTSENGYEKLSPWYADVRKNLKGTGYLVPDSFFSSPFLLMHAKEWRLLFDSQRAELAQAKEKYRLAGSK